MKLTAVVTLSLVTAVMLVEFDPTWAFRLQNSQDSDRRQQSDKHDSLIMTNNGGGAKGLSTNSIHGIGGSGIWPPPIPIWSFLPANKKSSPSSSSSSSSTPNKSKRQPQSKDLSSAPDRHLSYLDSSAPSSSSNLKSKSSSPIITHVSHEHHRNSVIHPLHDSMVDVEDGVNNEPNGLLFDDEDGEEEPWISNLKRSSPAGEVVSRKAEDSKRANRQYDVPQIECPPADDGMERFACPNPDKLGRYRCIDDHVLCDGYVDCPDGEDEDRQACMFYKTTKAHLDVLADALLRWARGKKR